MSNKIDDVFFSLLKTGDTGFKNIDTVFKNFDPSSIIKKMTKGSYFDNISIPPIQVKSSKLFHTTDNLKNLKNVSIDDVLAPDTSDILKGLKQTEVDPAHFNKTNKAMLDSDEVTVDLVNNNSLLRLQNIDENLENVVKKNAGDVGDGSIGNSDNFDNFKNKSKTNFNTPDEMEKKFKSQDGKTKNKTQSNKTDDVDDIAADANKRWEDISKTIDNLTSYGSIAIIAGYMYNLHANGNAPWSKKEFEEAFSDAVEVGDIALISYDTGLEHDIRVRAQEVRDNSNLDNLDNLDYLDNKNILIIAAVLIAFVSL